MKIIIYCQHVLGVGHFFRTLEIVKALSAYNLGAFDVILVTGGGAVEAEMPAHVRQVKLPGLMMDEDFSQLHSVDPKITVEEVKALRREKLLDLVIKEKPDFFMIELYPFGRRAFRFELVPVLEYITQEDGLDCKVVCSLRDILVEKKDTAKYEGRVIAALNEWFDGVLIHSDQQLITLDDTFNRLDQINVPLVYTGFVTPAPDPEKAKTIREKTGLSESGKLIVASAGGGNVGAKMLRAVIQAYQKLDLGVDSQLQVYTGPYMEDKDKKYLKDFESEQIKVKEFTRDFVSLLGAADLSVSMAGYNTSMNIVAAKVPSLVWPFGQNREQKKRARELARFAPMRILDDEDLAPQKFCSIIKEQMGRPKESFDNPLNIWGAEHTAKWIGSFVK